MYGAAGLVATSTASTLSDNNQNKDSYESDIKITDKSKVALITGGASGIGKSIANKCASQDFQVIIIVDINKNQLMETKQELQSSYPKCTILTFIADVSKRNNIVNLVKTLKNDYNITSITHLFNNAGILDALSSMVDNNPDNTQRLYRVIDINFWSHVNFTQLFLPLLKEFNNKSYIINTASLAGIMQGTAGIYGISKHAMVAYSECLHGELKQKGYDNINVLCVCPGLVQTGLVTNTANMSNDAEKKSHVNKDRLETWMDHIKSGIDASIVADKIFEAMDKGLFYVITHPQETYCFSTCKYQGIITRDVNQQELMKEIFAKMAQEQTNSKL